MELFIAIALLCGNPSNHDGPRIHSTINVQKCQKYYVKCVRGDVGNYSSTYLAKCILDKKKYGGDK